MEAVNRQSGVHQLINRDHYYAHNRVPEREMQHPQTSSTPLVAMSPTSMSYPNHPPPPYSHASAPPPSHPYSGLISPSQSQPPDSRRTSSDVKDLMQLQRQSLPSIQEALMAPVSFTRPRDPVDPSPVRQHPSYPPYPPTPTSRANSMDTGSYQNPSQPHRTSPPHPPQPSVYQRADPVGPSYEVPRPPSLPSLRTALPTSSTHHTAHGPPGHRPEPDPRAMGPLSAGYSHAPAPNGPHAAGPNLAHSPVFSPQSPMSQRQYRPRYDNGEEQHKIAESPASHKQYGPVVKRHLDYWDIEIEMGNIRNHATEIVKVSGDFLAISQRNNNHDSAPRPMPLQQDIDLMRIQHDKLTAAIGRMAERVSNAQGQYAGDQLGPPPMGKVPEDYPQEDMSWDEGRSLGGFAASDAKKRRGQRAAPPGRCHSCNRAETPEWRRGPDGARTLCNACGLHYAKLTRKLGSKQAISSLRPNSMEDVSPRS